MRRDKNELICPQENHTKLQAILLGIVQRDERRADDRRRMRLGTDAIRLADGTSESDRLPCK